MRIQDRWTVSVEKPSLASSPYSVSGRPRLDYVEEMWRRHDLLILDEDGQQDISTNDRATIGKDGGCSEQFISLIHQS
jgi:hypothetical protein